MSLLHPEKLRRCKRGGHEWYAEKYTRPDAQSPILGIGITKRSQDLARQTVHEKRTRRMEQYRFGPACGSSKIAMFDPPKAGPVAPQPGPSAAGGPVDAGAGRAVPEAGEAHEAQASEARQPAAAAVAGGSVG